MSLGGTFVFFRFSLLLFLGSVAWSARARSIFVSNHAAELLSPQFNNNIGRGERAMYIVLMYCFWYNIVAWILSIPGSGVLHLYLGLMDLGIVAALIPAVYWQSIYIPHSRGTCQNATSWQVSNAREESWFTVLAKLHNSADPDPEGRCNEYVANWTFAIIAIVIFSLLALFNILYGDWDASFTWDGFIKPWRRDRTENTGLLRIVRIVRNYLLLPLYIILYLSFLFPRTRERLYFGYRYFIKVLYRHRGRNSSSAASTVQGSSPHKNNTTFQDKYSDRLARLLILDISTLVASNLHYTDIQSLSLASSQIRETLFPTGNIRHHTAHFRLNSCNNPTGKKRCYRCQVQICDGCGFERELRDTPTSRHLEACKAHCTMCYKDTISGTAGQHWCVCKPYLGKQMVCVNCCKLPNEELVAVHDAWDRARLERSVMRAVPCSHCEADLETDGRRWWVCTRCGRECTNHIHPSWAPKSAV